MEYGKDSSVEIIQELRKVLEKLNGDMVIVGLVGSFRDTLSDEEILDGIKNWSPKIK